MLDELTETLIEEETIDFIGLYELVGKKYPDILESQKANFPPDLQLMAAEGEKAETATV